MTSDQAMPGNAGSDETERTLRLMLVRIDNKTFLDDFCAHYRRSGFSAELVEGGVVELGRPDAPDADQERREVLLHLRVWEAMNPDAPVETL
jgi:hypothetical protein